MSTGLGTPPSGGGSPAVPASTAPPRRTPTDSSYYDCHGVVNNEKDPNAKDWHYARDVRAQVAAACPCLPPRARGYPSHFGNKGPDGIAVPSLQASKPLTHTPITPGTLAPWKGGKRAKPGAHRAVYNDKDRTKVEVIYHDPSKPVPVDAVHKPFTQATYVPKASIPNAPVPNAPVPKAPVPKISGK